MDEYKPVTGELRRRGYLTEANIEVDGAVTFAKVYFGTKDFRDLCDDIDAVHAQLERENESLREKVRRQGVQLTEVQGALERRNNGELKRHWQKELDRIKAERDSMVAALDAAQGEHAYAPESHYMMLPKDADGVPIHVGDVLTDGECIFKVFELAAFVDGSWRIHNVNGNSWETCDVTHYHEPTVKDVLQKLLEQAVGYSDAHTTVALEAIEQFADKLRLADEKEQ